MMIDVVIALSFAFIMSVTIGNANSIMDNHDIQVIDNPEESTLSPNDADGNELVNISDAVYIILYIFGGGDAPQCP